MIVYDELEKTVAEAKRFIEKAEDAMKHQEGWGNKESAAAYRASLDLSMQLVKFRGTNVKR